MRIDKTLTCNLQELYGLEKAEGSSYHQVVPSLWGSKLYYSEFGWGKILKIVYAVWTFFFGSNSVIAKIKKSIKFTIEEFERQFQNLEEHFSSYQSSLVLLIEEHGDFDQKSYAKQRWIFTKWCDSTAPFIKLVQNGQTEKIDQLFKRFLGVTASEDSSIFRQVPDYNKILNYQRIIDVVRQVPVKAPFVALKKLSRKKELYQEEERAVMAWIESIHSLGERMKVKTFHRGMEALTKHIEIMHPSRLDRSRTDNLELGLAKHGLNIFRQNDPKHIQWCESLSPGTVLETRGKRYPIEGELRSCRIDNKLRVFTVRDNPNKVVVVGKNRAVLSVKKRGSQEYSWGIRPVHWHEVSPDGRFAVVERLKVPLHKRRWESEGHIDIRDILLLKPVVDQILWFIEQQGTPRNLDVAYLMYDQMDSLKSTKPLIQGELNYPKLVDFCISCANKNLVVYQYLVKETGLLDHAYRGYFKEVVKRTLQGRDDSAEDIGAQRQFQVDDYYVIEKGSALQREVSELQQACMRKLLDNYVISNPLLVADEVKRQIFKEYTGNNYICSLWPKMKRRVVGATAQKLNLSNADDDLY